MYKGSSNEGVPCHPVDFAQPDSVLDSTTVFPTRRPVGEEPAYGRLLWFAVHCQGVSTQLRYSKTQYAALPPRPAVPQQSSRPQVAVPIRTEVPKPWTSEVKHNFLFCRVGIPTRCARETCVAACRRASNAPPGRTQPFRVFIRRILLPLAWCSICSRDCAAVQRRSCVHAIPVA